MTVKLVPIEDLFDAVNAFEEGRAELFKQPLTQWREGLIRLQATFQAWCEERNLPIDFTGPVR